MRISDIFSSVQGEGRFAGTPSVFVRTTGCNLRCWYCDTPYTSWRPEGDQIAWQAVLNQVLAAGDEHVVITGGEPLLQPDVVNLSRALSEAGRYVTFETAGTVDRPVHANLMSISPKLANSTPREGYWRARHDAFRDRPEVINRLLADYDYQLKFVVDEPTDLADVEIWLRRFPQVTPDRVWLMAQAIDPDALRSKSAWLEEEASQRGFRLSPRLHIEQFGNARAR